MASIIIFGTAQLAELAHYYFTKDSPYDVKGFTLDDDYVREDIFLGLPVIPSSEVTKVCPPSNHKMFVAIGYSQMNQLRAAKFRAALEMGYELPGYISSRCTILTEKLIGRNCFILEDNTIQPFVEIGDNVVLWSGNHIGHHSVIEDHCFLTSHVVVSGNCHIGSHSFLGVNATLRNELTLGKATFVGMGVVMHKNTQEGEVYLPPRPQKWSKSSSDLKI